MRGSDLYRTNSRSEGSWRRVWGIKLLAVYPPSPFLVCLAVAVLGCLVAATFAAPAASGAVFYCNQTVYGYNNCPVHENGYFNYNQSYVPHASYGSVCENVTVYQRAGNISKNCSNTGAVDSFCDLYGYYNNGYELSGYAGNNQSLGQYIVGKINVVSEGTCV